MKFVIFSDIHYMQGEKPLCNWYKNTKRKLTELATPIMEKLIAQINAMKPDLVVNLGDLIEDLNDHDADVKNLEHIWNMLKSITPPFYSITGNHDLRTLSRAEVAHIMGYKNPTFSVDARGYHFVFLGLSSTIEKTDNLGGIKKTRVLPEEDLAWLRADLKKNKLPCVVFHHYGLAEDDMRGNWWFEANPQNADLKNRAEVKAILKTDPNLLCVFSGHQHWTKTIIEDGIPYHVIGSLTEDINGNGVPDGIWFEVDLKDRDVKITKHKVEVKV